MTERRFLPGRRSRGLPVLATAILLLVLLSSAGLTVLAARAFDAEEIRERLRARDRIDGAGRELGRRADNLLLAADSSVESDAPPAADLVGEIFLVAPDGTILLPRLRSHPPVDPPSDQESEAVASYVRKAREEAGSSGSPTGGVLILEESIPLYPHPDLTGTLMFECARMYGAAGNTARQRFFLTRLTSDLPMARDLDGRPLAPAAFVALLAILDREGDSEALAARAVEFATGLAEHAFGLSALERDRLLAGVHGTLSPEGLPDRVIDRASFVDALRARLIPDATAKLADGESGEWSRVVRKGPTGMEVLAWRVLIRDETPHVFGYRLNRGAFLSRLASEAESLARLNDARIRIDLAPPLVVGDPVGSGALEREFALGTELNSVGVRITMPPPAGAGRLKAIVIGMCGLLGAALLTGVILSVRAVRREWGAARLRQDFIDNVSHELRTPLTSIRMYAEMLEEEEELPEETRTRYREWILRESERLSRLVEDVLDLSRLSRGEPALRPEAVRPADLAGGVRDTWAPVAKEAGFRIDLEVPGDLPDALADRDAAHRALMNLVGNAIRYSGSSREVGIVGECLDNRVRLTVWDHGPGIPEAAREHLFTRFYRAPRDARRTKGVGLGLVLAREIVRAQGGDVILVDSSDEGSRFALELPIAEAPR